MSASIPSAFERLIIRVNMPISASVRSYHSTDFPSFPPAQLLSFLPLPYQLSLRHLSRSTKAWLDSAAPSLFSHLSVRFPFNTLSTKETSLATLDQLSALHTISPHCEHLTVTVSPYLPPPERSDVVTFPPLPRLQHLCLIAPDQNPFQSLLAFRLALQCAYLPLLTHLTINNLSISGIQALRWGSFTSFGDADWTGATVWHALRELDVQIVPWWDEDDDNNNNNKRHDVTDPPTNNRQQEPNPRASHLHRTLRLQQERSRTSTRVLHDWLHAFASSCPLLHTLHLSYLLPPLTTTTPPNPLLLDAIMSARPQNGKPWFSAPPVRWGPSLTSVWLGGVVVGLADVLALKERMGGLQDVGVQVENLEMGLGGRRVERGGEVWVVLGVEGGRVGRWEDVVGGGMGAGIGVGDTLGEGKPGVGLRGSWVPGRESVRMPARGSFGVADAASMEVPICYKA